VIQRGNSKQFGASLRPIWAIAVVISFPLILGACSREYLRNVEENQRRNQAEFQARRMTQLQETCDGFGFKRGTDTYAQCLQRASRDMNDAADKANEEQREQWRRAQCYATGRLNC